MTTVGNATFIKQQWISVIQPVECVGARMAITGKPVTKVCLSTELFFFPITIAFKHLFLPNIIHTKCCLQNVMQDAKIQLKSAIKQLVNVWNARTISMGPFVMKVSDIG